MLVKEGYKQTPVGLIPNSWDSQKLETILDISTGSKNAQDAVDDGEYPFFTRSVNTQRIDSYAYETEALFIAGEGNFAVKYYSGKFNVHQRTYVLTALQKKTVSLKFLQNAIQPLVYKLVNTSVGSTVQSLRKPIIGELQIPLPPLPEQQRIAEILSTVDDKLATIEGEISASEILKKGLMQTLLTQGIGHTQFKESPLGQIPESWDISTILALIGSNDILGVQDGNHGEIHPKSSDFVSEGIPFVMARDLIKGKVNTKSCAFISESQAKKLRIGFSKPGDILLSHKGTVGEVAIVSDAYDYIMLTPQVTYYRLNEHGVVDKNFLFQYFKSDGYQAILHKLAIQSTRSYLGITAQKKLSIVIPPKNEQIKIAEILSTVDSKLDTLTIKKSQYQTLKKGLMQKLLTGEVRVKV